MNADDVVGALIPEPDPYFPDQARQLIKAAVLHLQEQKGASVEHLDLEAVRELLVSGFETEHIARLPEQERTRISKAAQDAISDNT